MGQIKIVMEDINFDCPHCGQNLEAPVDMLGLFIECPGCKNVIKIQRAESSTPSPQKERSAPQETPADEKSTTMRMNLPPNLGVPEPKHRKVVIRRMQK